MPFLLNLPDDIRCYITSFVYPPSLLSLSITNKRVLACSEGQLKRHKKSSEKKRKVTHCEPLEVPLTLRHIGRDPSIACHIQNFEVWELRQGGHEWEALRHHIKWALRDHIFDTEKEEMRVGKGSEVESLGSHIHLDSIFYADSELSCLQDGLADVLRIDANHVIDWVDKLRSGYDEALKVMLFAQCPRLSRLTFMMYDI